VLNRLNRKASPHSVGQDKTQRVNTNAPTLPGAKGQGLPLHRAETANLQNPGRARCQDCIVSGTLRWATYFTNSTRLDTPSLSKMRNM